jgi:hypothetical protein
VSRDVVTSVERTTSDRVGGGDRSGRARLLVALVWVLVLEHLYALVTPPYELGIEHAFHFTFGVAYAWLALRLSAGRRWHRVLLTVLLGIQFVGRFFVFAAFTDTVIRVSLVPGALITLVVVWLLWTDVTTRRSD